MFAPSCDRRPVQYRSYPKNGPKQDKKVPLNEDNDIRAAHERYRHLTKDDEAREAYEARMKSLRDQANREESAQEEGREEGERRRAEAIALKLKATGMSTKQICELTGLTVEEAAGL